MSINYWRPTAMSINQDPLESMRAKARTCYKMHSPPFKEGVMQGRYETVAGAAAYYFYMAGFVIEHSTSDRTDNYAVLFEDMGWLALGVLKTLA